MISSVARIIFFGSTSDSVLILEKLRVHVCAIVTQPARPVGRKQVLTPTPVETWGKAHGIPVFSFPSDSGKTWLYTDERQVVDTLQPFKADLLVSACYGQKIPWEAIKEARLGGLNVHPSLLPRWRGADPVPWAILTGDHQAGVTIVTLSEKFDEGRIIAQKKIPIMDADTSEPLRTKLFTLGADLLMEALPTYLSLRDRSDGAAISLLHEIASSQDTPRNDSEPYARRLSRDDGFEPWEAIQKAFEDQGEALRIDRKFRAFFPWPGLWSKIKERRLKILKLHIDHERLVLDEVQWEGKKPIAYSPLLTAAS
ncbi:MAG: methionyl-tRNA formyltransferase [Patescibacteria group bacterium]